MTALEVYRRLLGLLRESGLSKQEIIAILDREAIFIKEEAGNLGAESTEEQAHQRSS